MPIGAVAQRFKRLGACSTHSSFLPSTMRATSLTRLFCSTKTQRIAPLSTNSLHTPYLDERKPNLPSPRSLGSLLARSRRRSPHVQFADVSVRVYEVTNYDTETDHPKQTLDWSYSEFSTKLPINQFEEYHREGVGLRSRTKAQLPKDFERHYRSKRGAVPAW